MNKLQETIDRQKQEMKTKRIIKLSVLAIPFATITLITGMWAYPKYRVYSQTMRGQADFKEAEINRQIRVEEARAEEEALMLEANGEAKREEIKAEATAKAVALVGKALEENPAYLRLHWINEVAGSEGDRIYIPTEAGMPILEAGATSK